MTIEITTTMMLAMQTVQRVGRLAEALLWSILALHRYRHQRHRHQPHLLQVVQVAPLAFTLRFVGPATGTGGAASTGTCLSMCAAVCLPISRTSKRYRSRGLWASHAGQVLLPMLQARLQVQLPLLLAAEAGVRPGLAAWA